MGVGAEGVMASPKISPPPPKKIKVTILHDSCKNAIKKFHFLTDNTARLSRGPTDYNGLQWTTMDYNGLQSTTIEYNGPQCTTMDHNGLQSGPIGSQFSYTM